MDIQSIKTFVQVVNLGNFTKAAEEMKYAQSTVTMQIQRLEKELGFQLFEHIGRKNYLTRGGQEFMTYAMEILDIMEKASSIGNNIKDIKGVIRIGVLESLLFAKVLSLLPKFRRDFPGVEVILKIGQSSELISLLKQNQLDIVYISHDINTDSALHCCYRRREKLIFAVSHAHPLAEKNKVLINEVFDCPFIVTEPTGYCYGHLCEIAAEHDLVLTHSVTVDSVAAIAELLYDDTGVAFLPEYSLANELSSGRLVKVDTDLPAQIYYSQLYYSKGKWLSPIMKSFIDYIHKAYPEED